jgi:hypothetical protein
MTNKDNFPYQHLSSDELMKYQLNQLTSEERQIIRDHLTECELCSDALNGMAEMKDSMRLYTITSDIKKKLRKHKTIRKKIFSTIDIISIVTLLFILGLMIFFTYFFIFKDRL